MEPHNEQVYVRLERDEDGYPPVDLERLWAERLTRDRYRLNNIPFYARGLAAGDVVLAAIEDGGTRLFISDVAVWSGNGTIRIVVHDGGLPLEDVHRIVREFGFDFENHPPLVAINLKAGDAGAVAFVERLLSLSDAGQLGFDIGCMSDVLFENRERYL